MLKTQRQESLIKLLEADSIMSVSDLSRRLNSSMMTIRRDLEYLEQKGIVKRIHGGVILSKPEADQPSFYERFEEFSAEKHAIGRIAAGMIQPGQIVFFDAGTTALAAVEYIPDDLEFTALTPGLLTAAALCNKPGVNLISLGGYIHKSSFSATNTLTIESILNFHANLAFITTKAFHFPEGTYEAQLPLIEVKRAMTAVSEIIILLADHSKFDKRSLSHAIPLEKINKIITDDKTPAAICESLRNKGIEIIQASL